MSYADHYTEKESSNKESAPESTVFRYKRVAKPAHIPEDSKNFLVDAQVRSQMLERRIQELELDLRHFQVTSEREKMELRELVQQLQGDKATLMQSIQKLEEDASKAQPLDLPRQGAIQEIGSARMREKVRELEMQIAAQAEEIETLRKSEDTLMEERDGLRKELNRNRRYQSEWNEERISLKRQLTALQTHHSRGNSQSVESASDLSMTAKPTGYLEGALLERTASFNESFSEEFCLSAPRQDSPAHTQLRNSAKSFRLQLERSQIEIDRAHLERDRALLELQEAKQTIAQLSQAKDEREGALKQEVKFLIGKLLKAKGKHEVLNETQRSFPTRLTDRQSRGRLNLSAMGRAGSPYSVSEVDMFSR